VRRPRRPTPPIWLSTLLVLVLGLVLSACDAALSHPPSSSPSAAPTDVPGTSPEPSAEASLPTQTATEWGRIWDAVPASFPRPPGSLDAEPIERVATSADLSVDGDAEGIIEFYVTMLTPTEFVLSTQGPLEDGSWVLDGRVPNSECKVQVTATPLGGLTHVSILYGAGCPFG
jgi:hypothetical protein